MSAKTKIVVLHMKELIYTAIFVGLGILLVVLLLFMFLPKKEKDHHFRSSLPAIIRTKRKISSNVVARDAT